MIYDAETGAPVGFEKRAIVSITTYEEDGLTYADFVYDKYEEVYGIKNTGISKVHLNRYISNGWCTFDESVGISSFEILDDRCPIREMTSIDEKAILRGMYRCIVTMDTIRCRVICLVRII